MSSIGVTPAKRTVSSSTSITAPALPGRPARARGARRGGRGSPCPSGTAATSPPGAVSSTCSRPAPKRISRRFEFSPHCAWKTNGTSCWKQPATTRAPEAEDAADQRRRGQDERVLRLERDRARDSHLSCEQAACDAGDERRERERPELVERDVDAGGQRGRLALADRRPGAPRLAGDVHQREQEQERADDDGVAVVRDVRRRPGWPSHGGRAGRERSGQRTDP